MKSVRETGFPSIIECDLYNYFLCLKGSHPALPLIWKVANFTDDVDKQIAEIVHNLQKNWSKHLNQSSQRAVRSILLRMSATKPYKAEHLIQTLLGDASNPNDANRKAILQRFHMSA